MSMTHSFVTGALDRVPDYLPAHASGNPHPADTRDDYIGRHRPRRWFAGRPRPSRTETGEQR